MWKNRASHNEEVQDFLETYLNMRAATYEEGNEKLVHWYDKCRNLHCEFVEKEL